MAKPMTETEWLDRAKIKMDLPRQCIMAYREHGRFVLCGEDALKLAYRPHVRLMPCRFGPMAAIRDGHAVDVFRTVLMAGWWLALARRRADDAGWCGWEVYKAVKSEEELDEIEGERGKGHE